jgi:hypothetical protein
MRTLSQKAKADLQKSVLIEKKISYDVLSETGYTTYNVASGREAGTGVLCYVKRYSRGTWQITDA